MILEYSDMNTMKLTLALALMTLGYAVSSPARAQTAPEGPLVCSASRAIECGEEYECGPPVPGQDRANFIHIDADNDTVTLLSPASRRGESSQIQAKNQSDTHLAISGVEGSRVWSAVVDYADMSVTITVADEEAAFVVFGQCIPADKTSP
jgi:hypothetical protein